MVAHGKDTRRAVALKHGAALHYLIGRIGGIRVKVCRIGRLAALRLARERGLVEYQIHCLQQLGICRHLLARLEQDDIAHDHLTARHLMHIAVPNDLDRRIIVHLVEATESLLVLPLQNIAHTRGKQHRNGYTYRLKIGRNTCLAAPDTLIERDSRREQQRHKQDGDKRVHFEAAARLVVMPAKERHQIGQRTQHYQDNRCYPHPMRERNARQSGYAQSENGQNGSRKTKHHQRVVPTVAYSAPQSLLLGRGKYILPVLRAALLHFGSSQPGIVMFGHVR